jgi:hypothetical protein
MNIAYLFESSMISGGHRVALAQADALIARGHRVRCVAKGPRPSWRETSAEWVEVDDLASYDASHDHFVVGTFFKTLHAAWAIAPGRAVHLCQGYEGSIIYYRESLPEIEAAYRLPLPKMVVSPHLIGICSRFNDTVACVGQIVDSCFHRETPPRENDPLRLLVVGEHQYAFRGIAEAYEAVRLARAAGASFDLVRVSSSPVDPAEPIGLCKEFHTDVPTTRMTEIMHSCDLLLAANHAVEGFGLPPAEAMTSGIPVILTRIPAFLEYDETRDYALWAEPGDAPSLADALRAMVASRVLRTTLASRGREVAKRFDAAGVAARIEAFLSSIRA